MFTLTNMLRTIVAIGVAGAALASNGVGGTGTPGVASQPPIVAKYIDPGKVGSAGVLTSDLRGNNDNNRKGGRYLAM